MLLFCAATLWPPHPPYTHTHTHTLISPPLYITNQCLYFLVSHIFCTLFMHRLFLFVGFSVGYVFSHAFAFSTNLTFVLLWSPAGSPLPPLASLCVRAFFAGPFGFPPIAFPLPRLAVCVLVGGLRYALFDFSLGKMRFPALVG